ncbi:hypothetical protein Zm00014a_011432 [Zea mays]|uniref:Uncharacterized protein n=1 Tax=Zea mays TaxID=4577 RepID=A0A317YE11_MAIZE|nr:hypothetical protein Zm00014a_011432 [Zea mays]
MMKVKSLAIEATSLNF